MANDDNITLVEDVIEKALKCGADAADVVYFQNNSLSVAQRLGKPEAIDRSEAKDLGLRVFIGARNASISTTDLKGSTLEQVIERVVSMAKESPEDEYAGIALGHQRLAIQDLSEKGNQPMHSESGRYVISFNGEIYNHLQIRNYDNFKNIPWRGHSDTETILKCLDFLGFKKTLSLN